MEEIEEMKRDLEKQGYTTKFQSTDKDYLVLVEKKPRVYCMHSKFYEGDTNILDVLSEDEFNRHKWEWIECDYTSFTSWEEFQQYEELYFVDDKHQQKMKKILMEGK
jgi:hypothetical protein